ncbi:hypothetical protein [Microbacterium sp. 77mftsu3.1]|uniref:hypothetical protein n=1 Tax=Microbacterium sp. 77mftsu3.1 TaxID=1761802 RepID=UPI00039A52E3|nr:hypothetical protein [Microbacterium sp. 77mftsu3.1]SDH37940.1 hypothetical protein SAMN04488590_3181 [Microbacterium sp. 77mftsu3.1]
MKKTAALTAFMRDQGYTPFDDPGFDAFRKGDVEVRFFWWSNAKHAERLGVARASLIVCPGTAERVDVSLVVYPSQAQPPRPWTEVTAQVADILATHEATLHTA